MKQNCIQRVIVVDILGLGVTGDSQRLPKMETREKHLLIQGMAHYAVAQRRSQLESI